MNQMDTIDIIIIVAYLVSIVIIGLWSARKEKKTSKGYFLANKSLTWSIIGASLFASNISTVHLVGLSESGFIDTGCSC